MALEIKTPDGRGVYIQPSYPVIAKGAANEMRQPIQEFIVPFWCCESVSMEASSNMKYQMVVVPVCGQNVTIPVLVNSRDIKKGETINVFRRCGATRKWDVPVDAENVSAKRPRKSL